MVPDPGSTASMMRQRPTAVHYWLRPRLVAALPFLRHACTVVRRKRYRGFESHSLRSRKPRMALRSPAAAAGFSRLWGECGGKLANTHRRGTDKMTPDIMPASPEHQRQERPSLTDLAADRRPAWV
jgi:hypothetical protein